MAAAQRTVACMQVGVAICFVRGWGMWVLWARYRLLVLWVAGREAGSTPVQWQGRVWSRAHAHCSD